MMRTEFLAAPGEGLFTINRQRPLQEHYLSQKFKGDKDQWKDQLHSLSHKICVLGVPSDSGAGVLKGSNWGPTFLRPLIQDFSYNDLGDIKCIPHLLNDDLLNEETLNRCRKALYQNEAPLPVSPLSILDEFSSDFFNAHPEKTLLCLGGDNSISYPLIKNWIASRSHKEIGVLHLDAHTDFSKDRLGVEVTFGSWAYHACKHLHSSKNFIQVGTRVSSHPKDYWEQNHFIKQFWAKEIRAQLFNEIDALIQYIKDQNIVELYLSLDLDVLDPSYFDLTGTPEQDGLEPHQLISILRGISENFSLTALDINEFSPLIHSKNYMSCQTTLQLIVQTLIKGVS